jgi:hypothetical protein
MATLKIKVQGQSLHISSDIPKIVEDSINYLQYEIEYSEDWQDYSKTVYFSREDYTSPGYSGGGVGLSFSGGVVDSGVITSPGFVIAILGAKGGQQITTEPGVVRVYPTGKYISTGEAPSKEQIEQWHDAIIQTVNNISTQVNIIDAKISGISETANEALTVANEAKSTAQSAENKASNAGSLAAAATAEVEALAKTVERVEENLNDVLEENIGNITSEIRKITLLSTAWTANNGNYYQEITNLPKNCKIDLQFDIDTFETINEYGLSFIVKKTEDTKARIYALNIKPTINLPAQVQITILKNTSTEVISTPIGTIFPVIDWNASSGLGAIINKPNSSTENDIFNVNVENGVCIVKINKELYYEEKEV